jgi:hypothetical protein
MIQRLSIKPWMVRNLGVGIIVLVIISALSSCDQNRNYQSTTVDYLNDNFRPWSIKVVDGSILRAVASQTDDAVISDFALKLSRLTFLDMDYDDDQYSSNLYKELEESTEAGGLGVLASIESAGTKSASFSKDDGKTVEELVVLIDDGSSIKVLVAVGSFSFDDIPISGLQDPGSIFNNFDNLISF